MDQQAVVGAIALFGLGIFGYTRMFMKGRSSGKLKDILPEAKVVDVRSAAEFKEERFPGAINIPLDRLQKSTKKLGEHTTKSTYFCAKRLRCFHSLFNRALMLTCDNTTKSGVLNTSTSNQYMRCSAFVNGFLRSTAIFPFFFDENKELKKFDIAFISDNSIFISFFKKPYFNRIKTCTGAAISYLITKTSARVGLSYAAVPVRHVVYAPCALCAGATKRHDANGAFFSFFAPIFKGAFFSCGRSSTARKSQI